MERSFDFLESFSAPFLQNGIVQVTTEPENPLVDLFFSGYDRAFVLPDEKESLIGFRDCLHLNFSPEYDALAARYGPYREMILVAFDSAGNVIGGANLICFPIVSQNKTGTDSLIFSANLNYIYILAESRQKGYFQGLLDTCKTVIRRVAGALSDRGLNTEDHASVPLFIFTEQNNPYKMSAEAYALDTRQTGLDQIERLKIWGRAGSRILDFPYVQPPLSPTQQCDEGLIYAVIQDQNTALDPILLKRHLEGFFGISVLKGKSLQSVRVIEHQFSFLDQAAGANQKIGLLDPLNWIERERLAKEKGINDYDNPVYA